jgi:hypothetical protein
LRSGVFLATLLLLGCPESPPLQLDDDSADADDDAADDDSAAVDCAGTWITELQDVTSGAITVDWSGLTEDLHGEPLDPAHDLDELQVMALALNAGAARQKICDDALQQSDVAVLLSPVELVPNMTSASVDTTDMGGWTLVAAVRTGGATRSMALATLHEDILSTTVYLTTGGAVR